MFTLLLKQAVNYACSYLSGLIDFTDLIIPGELSTTERITLDGEVTHVFGDCGIIDNSFVFSWNDLQNANKFPTVGAKISAVLFRDESSESFIVSSVNVIGDNENNEDETTSDAAETTTGTGTITSFDGQNGTIDNVLDFSISDLSEGYVCDINDVVKYEKCEKSLLISPNRHMEYKGNISYLKDDYGFVDSVIFFRRTNLFLEEVKCGDVVTVIAVESINHNCIWRAMALIKTEFQVISVENRASDDNNDNTKREEDDNVVLLEGSFTCKLPEPEQTSELIITVKNKRSQSLTLNDVVINEKLSVFSVLGLSNEKSVEPELKLPYTIESESSVKVILNCIYSPDILKRFAFITFEFSECKKTETLMCYTDELLNSNSYAIPSYTFKDRVALWRQLAFADAPVRGRRKIVPSTRRLRFKKSSIPYEPPESLRVDILNNKKFDNWKQLLNAPLDPQNYESKLHLLIHIEEIFEEINFSRFTLKSTQLLIEHPFLTVSVPFLGDDNFTLMVNDKVVAAGCCCVSDNDPTDGMYEGFIHKIEGTKIYIQFDKAFHDAYKGEYTDIYFKLNKTLYRRYHEAIYMSRFIKRHILFPQQLDRVPVRSKKASEELKRNSSSDIKWYNENLNKEQREAVRIIIEHGSRPFPFLILGPPGTGKTITLIESIIQVFVQHPYSKILVCAPSNHATDILCERLTDSKIFATSDLLRLHSLARGEIPAKMLSYSVQCNETESDLSRRVIITTFSSTSRLFWLSGSPLNFTHIFMDECGQAHEPETLMPLSFSQTDTVIVMAGDPFQLGPFVRSLDVASLGLSVSLMERLMTFPTYKLDGSLSPKTIIKLKETYRFQSPHLVAVSSRLFYGNELCAKKSDDETESNSNYDFLLRNDFPLLFLDVVHGRCSKDENSPSWYNAVEVMHVCRFLINFKRSGILAEDVGVITPYRKQIEKINLMLKTLNCDFDVKVGSVEEFQGDEKKIIVLSTVRSFHDQIQTSRQDDLNRIIGFLQDSKRFNVSITRAKCALVIIGDSRVLSLNKCWSQLIEFCKQNNVYKSDSV